MAVSTFIVTCAPSCCSLRELLPAMSRCEVLGRVSPGRVSLNQIDPKRINEETTQCSISEVQREKFARA